MAAVASAGGVVSRLVPVISLLRPLSDALAGAGRELSIVGGMVRDAARGVPLDSDVDAATDAGPDEVVRLLSPVADEVRTQGRAFGVVVAVVSGVPVEVATYRSEVYDGSSRRPQVSFVRTLDEDLSRRDFTVNAMAVRLPSGELADPFGGMEDLRRGVLRAPADPVAMFSDDPLRMFRAARFASALSLTPDPSLLSAARSCRSRASSLSPERIGFELRRTLAAADPSPALEFLYRTGLWQCWTSGQGFASSERRPPQMRPAAAFCPALSWAIVVGHGRDPDAGAALMRLVGVARPLRAAALRLMRLACLLGEPGDVRGSARSLCSLYPPAEVDAAMEVLWSWRRPCAAGLLEELRDVETSCGPALRSMPVDGADVMHIAGLSGPAVGAALAALRAEHVQSGPMSRSEAVERLSSREWLSACASPPQ